MGAKNTLGEFEHHVLLAAMRLGPDAYTTSIMLELESCTGKGAAAAAVYIALRRLENSGLVTSRLRHSGEHRTRRYIRVTPAGHRLVSAARRRLVRLWDGLNFLPEER